MMTTNIAVYPPRSIRQLKERVANLRGKHKQMYSLAVKEADPKVNWDALVDEKLVRSGAGPSPSTSALLLGERDCITESSGDQRRTVPSLESHSQTLFPTDSATPPHAYRAGVCKALWTGWRSVCLPRPVALPAGRLCGMSGSC